MHLITRHRQSIAPQGLGVLRLPVSEIPTCKESSQVGILSPYFQLTDTRKEATGRDTKIISTLMDLVIYGFFKNASTWYVNFGVAIGGGNINDEQMLPISPAPASDSYADVLSAAQTAIIAYFVIQGYPAVTAANMGMMNLSFFAGAPSSYQTIITQTGTSAPAVSGSLSPISTYPSGTTFTWARTSAGVYTLTASTAVFNTSGKTGVFIGSLNNPNGAYKAVVTSSTVITITTYLQSLAVLGLLSFTATATDALLTQTMVYVQTYA